jgi:hypothetical protein
MSGAHPDIPFKHACILPYIFTLGTAAQFLDFEEFVGQDHFSLPS